MAIIEDRGVFWWNDAAFPKTDFRPEEAEPGVLTVREDGSIKLVLDGKMPRRRGQSRAALLMNRGQEAPVNIQGLLWASTKYVFLSKVSVNGGAMRTHNVSYDEYYVTSCLVSSKRFRPDNKKPLTFRSVQVGLDGLEKWLWLRPLAVKRRKNSVQAKFRKDADVRHRLSIGDLTLKFGFTAPFNGHRSAKLEIAEQASLVFQPKKRMSLELAEIYNQRIEELILLLTSSDYRLPFPWLVSADGQQRARLYHYRPQTETAAPDPHRCLVRFPDIAPVLGQLFQSYLDKRETFGPGFYLYLGMQRAKMFIEHRFANMMWGLEALHRRKFGNVKPGSEIQAKVDRILSSVPKRDRTWLTGRLKNSAEPSLSARLIATFNALPIGFDRSGLQKFCEECASRRNDISHFGGPRVSGQKYDDLIRDLNDKANALSGLYCLTVLTEIGIAPEVFDFKANHNWPLSQIERSLRHVGVLGKG